MIKMIYIEGFQKKPLPFVCQERQPFVLSIARWESHLSASEGEDPNVWET